MNHRFDNSALVIIDVQNDFCPGGSLAVEEGDQVVGVINRLMPHFSFVVATQDWHTPDHISFKAQGGPWPPHCVRDSWGAQLHPELKKERVDLYIRKDSTVSDAYSGFEGVDERGRSLKEVLSSRKVTRLYLAGLATDYCVRVTALDALKAGYEVRVVTDGVRAVNVTPDDGANALREMSLNGARLVTSSEVLQSAASAS